jgi:hypothetical protein
MYYLDYLDDIIIDSNLSIEGLNNIRNNWIDDIKIFGLVYALCSLSYTRPLYIDLVILCIEKNNICITNKDYENLKSLQQLICYEDDIMMVNKFNKLVDYIDSIVNLEMKDPGFD